MTPTRILVWSALVAIVLWLLAASGQIACLNMGSLEPLFTGFAFCGLVATFVHERQNAREQDKDVQALIDALKKQAEISAHTARIAAITIMAPASWMLEDSFEKLGARCMQTAREIEQRLRL